MDPGVAACALRLPELQLIKGGFTKAPLRELAAQELPALIAWRRAKVGFEPPTGAWLAASAMRCNLRSPPVPCSRDCVASCHRCMNSPLRCSGGYTILPVGSACLPSRLVRTLEHPRESHSRASIRGRTRPAVAVAGCERHHGARVDTPVRDRAGLRQSDRGAVWRARAGHLTGGIEIPVSYICTALAAAATAMYCERRKGPSRVVLVIHLVAVIIPLQALVAAQFELARPEFAAAVALAYVASWCWSRQPRRWKCRAQGHWRVPCCC